MAIYKRSYTDNRTYFNTETALIKTQEAKLKIKIFGIPVVDRDVVFTADNADQRRTPSGFNK